MRPGSLQTASGDAPSAITLTRDASRRSRSLNTLYGMSKWGSTTK